MKKIVVLVLCMLLHASAFALTTAGAQSMEPKFVFFPKRKLSKDSPYLHPRLGESNIKGVFIYVASVPVQGDLRIYQCRAADKEASDTCLKGDFFDAPDPNPKDRTGMPAFGGGGGTGHPYAVFADGSRFESYIPPDAKPIGTEEWRYHLRWERVTGNYYAVTVYRGTDIIRNGLYTEKDGRDLSSALGESSQTKTVPGPDGVFATFLGDKIEIYYDFPKRSERDFLSLVEVKEEELPEDFPKGLVLWLK